MALEDMHFGEDNVRDRIISFTRVLACANGTRYYSGNKVDGFYYSSTNINEMKRKMEREIYEVAKRDIPGIKRKISFVNVKDDIGKRPYIKIVFSYKGCEKKLEVVPSNFNVPEGIDSFLDNFIENGINNGCGETDGIDQLRGEIEKERAETQEKIKNLKKKIKWTPINFS